MEIYQNLVVLKIFQKINSGFLQKDTKLELHSVLSLYLLFAVTTDSVNAFCFSMLIHVKLKQLNTQFLRTLLISIIFFSLIS